MKGSLIVKCWVIKLSVKHTILLTIMMNELTDLKTMEGILVHAKHVLDKALSPSWAGGLYVFVSFDAVVAMPVLR